jgi:hypothetical protein
VEYPDRAGLARFRWFPIDQASIPDAYVCVVQQLTPELTLAPLPARHSNAPSGCPKS